MDVMTMAPATAYERALDTGVFVEDVQEQTVKFAKYRDAVEPEAVLNRGMLAEIPEVLHELRTDKPYDPAALASELGDFHWYVAEKARYHGISMSAICGSGTYTLDEYQRQQASSSDISRMYRPDGSVIHPWSDREEAWSVLTIRVVDAETRSDDRLWVGQDESLTLEQTLRDLYTYVAVTADIHGLRMSDIHKQTLHKLRTRGRDAHVVHDANARPATPDEIAAKRDKKRYELTTAAMHLFQLDWPEAAA